MKQKYNFNIQNSKKNKLKKKYCETNSVAKRKYIYGGIKKQ